MDKDNYTNENDTVDSEQLFFKINNRQVVFKTDKRTVEKLDDGMFRNVYIIVLADIYFQVLLQYLYLMYYQMFPYKPVCEVLGLIFIININDIHFDTNVGINNF